METTIWGKGFAASLEDAVVKQTLSLTDSKHACQVRTAMTKTCHVLLCQPFTASKCNIIHGRLRRRLLLQKCRCFANLETNALILVSRY